MFHKPGKNKKSPSNYRPISLLTTLSKLLEKVILIRLNEDIERLDILPPFQFGFRKEFSTCHQLQRIVEIIEDRFENKKYTVALFLDITQAFDRVWLEELKYKILQTKINEYIKAILLSFLEDRTFAVKIHNITSTVKDIRAGVPQGSILGPILFNIFMHDIPDTKSDLAMYADDTVLITQNWNLAQAITQLQSATNTINKWFKRWNISINQSKCTTKVFTLKRIHQLPEIIINDNNIQWNLNDQAVKYLGVHLDARLTWKYHILKKLNESHTRMVQLYPIINRKSSMKPECTMLIYKSLIRPLMTYACVIWGNTSISHINRIQVLQNKILRMAVDAPWYVRNDQLHFELGILTIKEFIKKLTKKFHLNISNCPSADYYSLGRKGIHTRLRRKLPQDIYISDSDSA